MQDKARFVFEERNLKSYIDLPNGSLLRATGKQTKKGDDGIWYTPATTLGGKKGLAKIGSFRMISKEDFENRTHDEINLTQKILEDKIRQIVETKSLEGHPRLRFRGAKISLTHDDSFDGVVNGSVIAYLDAWPFGLEKHSAEFTIAVRIIYDFDYLPNSQFEITLDNFKDIKTATSFLEQIIIEGIALPPAATKEKGCVRVDPNRLAPGVG